MSRTFKVLNVYVTGNTNTGENQISRQDMMAWFTDYLQIDIKDIVELGKGYHYCQMINVLFPSVNPVPLKNVKFGAKAEHEYTENWKKLQNAFKKLEVDKVIPIEKLIKLKMMDNMEFAQWFKKFFDANTGQDECFGQYDSAAERSRVNAVVPAATGGRVVGAGARKVPPPAGGAKPLARPGAAPSKLGGTTGPAGAGAKTAAAPPAAAKAAPPARKPIAPAARAPATGDSSKDAANQQLINDLQAQLDEAVAQNEGRVSVIEGLERERDFYFSKLRDIEILAQEHEESGQLPDENVLKRILDILYATEEGFIAPEDEEDGLAEGDFQDQQQLAEPTGAEEDETY